MDETPGASQAGTSKAGASALKSGTVYTLAQTIPKVVSFILLPVFTRVLSPSDYGQLSVALAASAVAAILFALGLEAIIFRVLFQLEAQPASRQRFISSVWTFLLIASPLMALFLTVCLAPLLGTSHVLTTSRLGLALLGSALLVSATTLPLTLLRAENRKRDYLIVTGICTLGSTLLTVAFVVFLHGGVTGWLLALLSANLLALLSALRLVPYRRPRPLDRGILKDTLRLSLPLLPHFTSMWSLQLVDRLLVASILSTAATGLYSLGSNLALPMLSVVIGFSQGFMPAYARAGVDNDQSSLSRVITLQIAVVAVLCVAFALLGPPAVHLLANSRYAAAAPLIPWIVLGYGFLGLYAVPMNGITLTHGRTKGVAVVSGIGAATNIGAIIALAPPYGIEAVAIASAIGYCVLLIGILIFAKQRKAGLTYPYKRISAIIGGAVVGYTLGELTVGNTDVLDFFMRLCWALATLALVAAISLYPEIPAIRDVRHAVRRLRKQTHADRSTDLEARQLPTEDEGRSHTLITSRRVVDES